MVTEAVGIVVAGVEVGVARSFADTVVTEDTPTDTELTEVHPAGSCLHPWFRREFPTCRNRWEVTPAIFFREHRRAVDTDVGLEQIAVEEAIVQSADETYSSPFAVEAVGLVAGVAARQMPHVVVV